MPILVTTPNLEQQGGVAAYYATLRKHLDAEVHFCQVGSRTAHPTALAEWVRLLRDYGHFYRTVRSGRYDLIHLNPSLGHKALLRDGLFLLIAKSLGRKVLVFVHGWNPVCEAAIRRWFLPLFRWVYFRADAFVVLASQFQSVLREFGYDKPIYLETMVVADEVFRPADPPTAGSARLGPLNILFLSRVEKAKGIYEAVEAFRLLRQKHPCVRLTVAGDGSELDPVKAYVRSQKVEDVAFLGWVRGPSKREAFANADLYLFPTYHGEGMPNSVLEAMAYGLPVVTRPVGGVRDFFEDGTMGFLTDSRKPAVFASLLERLLLDPHLRRTMARYNRRYAWKHFAAAAVARRLTEMYRRTSGGTQGPEGTP